MTIVTRRRTGEFTTVPNEIASDDRLSFEERGLLLYLLSKPDNWKVNIQDIRREGKIGRDKTYKLLRNLQTVGYIVAEEQSRLAETNQFTSINYIVYDCLETAHKFKSETSNRLKSSTVPVPRNQYSETPFTENQDTVENKAFLQNLPLTENQDADSESSVSSHYTPLTENQYTEEVDPYTGKPYTANQDALIKDIYNNTPLNPPSLEQDLFAEKSIEERKARSMWGRNTKLGKLEAEALFESLWESWPKGFLPDSKSVAAAHFKKLNEIEQHEALSSAEKYFRWVNAQKRNPLMITYLCEKIFKQFSGDVEINENGYFVIKRGTHEWDLWKEWLLETNGALSVQKLNALPSLERTTRFPKGREPEYAK